MLKYYFKTIIIFLLIMMYCISQVTSHKKEFIFSKENKTLRMDSLFSQEQIKQFVLTMANPKKIPSLTNFSRLIDLLIKNRKDLNFNDWLYLLSKSSSYKILDIKVLTGKNKYPKKFIIIHKDPNYNQVYKGFFSCNKLGEVVAENPRTKTSYGKSILYEIVKHRLTDAQEYMLNNKTLLSVMLEKDKIPARMYNLIIEAGRSGQVDFVKGLLLHGVQLDNIVSTDNEIILFTAIREGLQKLVSVLLSNGVKDFVVKLKYGTEIRDINIENSPTFKSIGKKRMLDISNSFRRDRRAKEISLERKLKGKTTLSVALQQREISMPILIDILKYRENVVKDTLCKQDESLTQSCTIKDYMDKKNTLEKVLGPRRTDNFLRRLLCARLRIELEDLETAEHRLQAIKRDLDSLKQMKKYKQLYSYLAADLGKLMLKKQSEEKGLKLLSYAFSDAEIRWIKGLIELGYRKIRQVGKGQYFYLFHTFRIQKTLFETKKKNKFVDVVIKTESKYEYKMENFNKIKQVEDLSKRLRLLNALQTGIDKNTQLSIDVQYEIDKTDTEVTTLIDELLDVNKTIDECEDLLKNCKSLSRYPSLSEKYRGRLLIGLAKKRGHTALIKAALKNGGSFLLSMMFDSPASGAFSTLDLGSKYYTVYTTFFVFLKKDFDIEILTIISFEYLNHMLVEKRNSGASDEIAIKEVINSLIQLYKENKDLSEFNIIKYAYTYNYKNVLESFLEYQHLGEYVDKIFDKTDVDLYRNYLDHKEKNQVPSKKILLEIFTKGTKKLIREFGANINELLEDSKTPIIAAVQRQDIEIINEVLKLNPDFSIGNWQELFILLSKQKDIEIRERIITGLLKYAISHKYYSFVHNLINFQNGKFSYIFNRLKFEESIQSEISESEKKDEFYKIVEFDGTQLNEQNISIEKVIKEPDYLTLKYLFTQGVRLFDIVSQWYEHIGYKEFESYDLHSIFSEFKKIGKFTEVEQEELDLVLRLDCYEREQFEKDFKPFNGKGDVEQLKFTDLRQREYFLKHIHYFRRYELIYKVTEKLGLQKYLMHTFENKNLELLEFLVEEFDADINILFAENMSILDVAIARYINTKDKVYKKMSRYLIRKGAITIYNKSYYDISNRDAIERFFIGIGRMVLKITGYESKDKKIEFYASKTIKKTLMCIPGEFLNFEILKTIVDEKDYNTILREKWLKDMLDHASLNFKERIGLLDNYKLYKYHIEPRIEILRTVNIKNKQDLEKVKNYLEDLTRLLKKYFGTIIEYEELLLCFENLNNYIQSNEILDYKRTRKANNIIETFFVKGIEFIIKKDKERNLKEIKLKDIIKHNFSKQQAQGIKEVILEHAVKHRSVNIRSTMKFLLDFQQRLFELAIEKESPYKQINSSIQLAV